MKKEIKNFSLIMSVYNGTNPYLLSESLKSLLYQRYTPQEILIMFDGPLNARITFLLNSFIYKNQHNLKIRKYANKKNLGIVKSYNYLINHANNKLVAIHDSDDCSHYQRFYYQYNFLNINKSYSVVGSSIYENFIHESKKLTKKMPISNISIKKRCKYSNPMNHPTVMFKKNDLIKFKYKNFYRMEDYYLWIRMIKKNKLFYNINKNLVSMNIDNNFFKRRSDYKILFYEFKIQKKLYLTKFNSLILTIFLIFLKCSYHMTPFFLKKKLRSFALFFLSKKQNQTK